MIQTIRKAWAIPELRKKIIFTLLILLIFRIGNAITVPYVNVAALEHARRAAALEPDNMSYRSLVQQFESGGTWYEQRQATYGYPSFGGGSMCLRMCIANMICTMCCLGGGCCGGRGMYYY